MNSYCHECKRDERSLLSLSWFGLYLHLRFHQLPVSLLLQISVTQPLFHVTETPFSYLPQSSHRPSLCCAALHLPHLALDFADQPDFFSMPQVRGHSSRISSMTHLPTIEQIKAYFALPQHSECFTCHGHQIYNYEYFYVCIVWSSRADSVGTWVKGQIFKFKDN